MKKTYITFGGHMASVRNDLLVMDDPTFENYMYRRIGLSSFTQKGEEFVANIASNVVVALPKMPTPATTAITFEIRITQPDKWAKDKRYVCPGCGHAEEFKVKPLVTMLMSSHRAKGNAQVYMHAKTPLGAEMDDAYTSCMCPQCDFKGALSAFKCHEWQPV